MTTETLLWLFPSVFMLHEFEEIIGFRPWWERNRAELLNRFPRTGQRLRRLYDPLSTSAFAFAVAEEFVLVSVLTFLSVRFGWTALFAGLVIAYLIHLGVHIGQWLVWRRYAPMIVTSLLTAPYALYVLYALNQRGAINAGETVLTALIVTPVVFLNLVVMLRLAQRFERWVRRPAAV
jgi:Protein of unknown function with HXXEE motif